MKSYRNPEVLRKLYCEEGLSIIQIAKKLSVSKNTIFYSMKKLDIPRRSKKLRSDITKKLLGQLYLEEKLSMRKIAKLLNTTYNTIWKKMKRYGIRRRMYSEANMKYPKSPFSGNLKEKAYVLGLRAGDISAHKIANQIRVYTSTTHIAQLKMFKEVFGKYSIINFYISRQPNGKIEWRVYCHLDKSFYFLLNKLSKIPKWILENEEYFYAFLAGYVDCEGYWQIYMRKTTKKVGVRLRIASGDKTVLEQIYNKLELLGLNPKFRLSHKRGYVTSFGRLKKEMYEVSLNSEENILRVAQILLNLSLHEEKLWKMKLILEDHDKSWTEIRSKVEELRKWIKNTRINDNVIPDLQLPLRAMTSSDEYLLRISSLNCRQ